MDIGLKKNLPYGYDEAMQRVPEALKAEGFGVLTTIDVKDTLKAKLGVDFRRYTILGACNPPLAHRALSAHLGFGLLMPCNVTVHEGEDGKAVVQAVDPLQTVAPQVSKELAALAGEVREKLARVLEKL
ncbi:MAG: DUF302 domain-containing protein [Myxococcales bacterium]|nr:DUF302 domain-containing protein [Myxococcales bacterium]